MCTDDLQTDCFIEKISLPLYFPIPPLYLCFPVLPSLSLLPCPPLATSTTLPLSISTTLFPLYLYLCFLSPSLSLPPCPSLCFDHYCINYFLARSIKILPITLTCKDWMVITMWSYLVGDGYHIFGWQAMVDLFSGLDWQASPMFPRITLCSFEIRRMGNNIHRYTVQCLLSVNLFNEKVRKAQPQWN